MVPDFKRFSAIRLFRDFNLHQLTAVFEKIQAIPFERGDTILSPDSSHIGLYFVMEGSVRISVRLENQEVGLTVIFPGDFFGEVSVVEGGAPSAIACAEEPTLVYLLPRKEFIELIESSNALAARVWEAMARVMIERLKRSNAMVQQYFEMNKALCENPKFREFYQLCQFGS